MILGNQPEFALECLVDQKESDPLDYLFGYIALWAGGFIIGDFTQLVMLDVPYAYFQDSLIECGQRKDIDLIKMTAIETWEFLNFALYGNHESDIISEQIEEKYRKFCICPGFSEAFDGEIAFLIEDENEERFIWKDFLSQSIKDVRLKPETYKRTIESFISWYSSLSSI